MVDALRMSNSSPRTSLSSGSMSTTASLSNLYPQAKQPTISVATLAMQHSLLPSFPFSEINDHGLPPKRQLYSTLAVAQQPSWNAAAARLPPSASRTSVGPGG